MNIILYKLKEFYKKIKEQTKVGYKWIGIDGLLNMETSALLTIFFHIFISNLSSIIITFLIMFCKCLIDYYNGHINEKHDFICVCVGIFMGALFNLT